MDANTLAEECRAAGLKATSQRLAVLQAVRRRLDHPSPDMLLGAVRTTLPTISLATVYRTLDSLTDAGLLRQVSLHQGKRYDGNLEDHHHLVCAVCGAVSDYEDREITPAIPANIDGFVPERVRLQFVGRCASCIKSSHPSG